MKKLFGMLIAGTMGSLTLLGLEFPIDNATPFKIVKIEVGDWDDDEEVFSAPHTLTVSVPAKKRKTVSVPDQHKECNGVKIHFENGKNCFDYVVEGDLTDIARIEISVKDGKLTEKIVDKIDEEEEDDED